MPYPSEHAARVRDPGDFIEDSFRRKNIAEGIDIIIGKLKEHDEMVAQTYRFNVEKFTAAQAKKWLKDNDIDYISFEAASQNMKNVTLKIYGIIGDSIPNVDGEQISARAVSEFLDKNQDATDVTVRINSPGGDVQEGWAIYDLLVNSRKRITTVGEGKIHSIATIVFLAGSERLIMKNADGLIHNPYIPEFTLSGKYESTDLIKIAESLKQEEEKILNFYAEKTGAPIDKLAQFMKEDTKLSAEDMLALGFATRIVEPIKAFAYIKPSNIIQMDEKAFFEKLGSALDNAVLKMKNFSRIEPKNMVIPCKEGEVTLEKEAGEPEVGDRATPDGTFTLENGTVITIADGAVKEVTMPAAEESELDKAKKKICELESQIEALNAEKVDLSKAEASMKEKEAEASVLIADLSALKNSWKPESRSKMRTVAEKVGEINMDRVRELNEKLNTKTE